MENQNEDWLQSLETQKREKEHHHKNQRQIQNN